MEASATFLFCCVLFLNLIRSTAVDTIETSGVLVDGDVLESAGGFFQLGFVSHGSSKRRYLAIWYKKTGPGTVVWMANNDRPINGTSGLLKVSDQGSLLLMKDKNTIIWSSNSLGSVRSPVAQLLDSGNLLVKNADETNPDIYLWQSFDHPGDTLLPGMKLGSDFVKGLERKLTSWKSVDDPSPGKYTCSISLDGYPQLFVWFGSVVQYRLESWEGMKFGSKNLTDTFVINENETYYSYDIRDRYVLSRMVMSPNGTLQLLTWTDQNKSWEIYFTAQSDACNHYGLCGAYGSCYSTGCQCLRGFKPKFSDGCSRAIVLKCRSDGFLKFSGMRLPDTQRSSFDPSANDKQCQRNCLKDCACTAYAYMDIKEGQTGCLLWFGDLIDMGVGSSKLPDLYVRVAASELGRSKLTLLKRRVAIAAGVILPTVSLLVLFLILVLKRIKGKLRVKPNSDAMNQSENQNQRDDVELPLFEFAAIANATSNFSNSNKLGQGGFGPVYKGILEEGKEIAVKRLSRNSKQGLHEFKNEIACIVKLQHRNLVRLLGCCIQEGEMLLIYEYMPNRSLDSIIFDKRLSNTLDWPMRYNIIKGIAKGLLYLHQDSRLRIIHRDLKASNILLDHEKNPRISDFGLARSFGGSDIEVNTTRVAGTQGYISPEYLIDGVFSTKSDVYSFGVVVLEIVSGQKIRDFCRPDENLNLLGYAWKLYEEGNYLELVDEAIMSSCNASEVLRAIQIGLLCVQPYARDRPNMSSVVAMLSRESELPQPKQPGFFTERQLRNTLTSVENIEPSGGNELTVTFSGPR